jgi:DNA-directed RNA polymerase subunit RPC12/RpoP
MEFKGRLPTEVGEQTIIECPKCGKKYQVTYHGEAMENDTYTYNCSCGHKLFTETDRKGYSVKEAN